MATWLKLVLQQKHLQNHDLFAVEYVKVATSLDLPLAPPSRAQFHRWLSGELSSLPHPRHCRVLEAVLPPWTAADLFARAAENQTVPVTAASTTAEPSLRAKAEHGRALVDLHTRISIDIDDEGRSTVRYCYTVLNLTDLPITRLVRGVWFRHTYAPLTIEPLPFAPYQTFIERIHDAGDKHTKFAYHFSPPIPPGASGQYGCEVTGGQFLDELYWRHTATKHTERLTISVLHRGKRLKHCHAVEELVTGSERLITDQLHWRQTAEGLSLELDYHDLEPTQVVTTRWEVHDT